MFGDWVIGAFVRFETNGAVVMARLASSTRAANEQLLRQQGLIDANSAAMLRYQRRIDEIRMAQARMRAMMAGAVAVVGGVAIGASIAKAGAFQLAMTGTNLSLATNAAQQQALQRMALHVSDVTAQNATTIAQEMSTAAGAGINSFQRMITLFPLLARFADVQYFMAKSRGQTLSPQNAVSYGVQFSHLFQAYTPAKMGQMLEWITKLQTVQPEPLIRALTQARYFIPLGHVLGLNMAQEFSLLAAMGQTGFLKGRGGSSLGRTFLGAINAATLTGHAQSKQTAALRELGILSPDGRNVVVTKSGELDWTKFSQILTGDSARMKPATYASDLKAAFGIIATQFLDVFASGPVQKQMKTIQAQFARLGGDPIGRFFNQLMSNFFPALQKFMTNFANLGINIFLPVLPAMTKAFTAMADILGRLGDWFGAHPQAGFTTAIAAMAVVAATAIYAGLNLRKMAAGMIAIGDIAGLESLGGAGRGIAGAGRRGFLQRLLFGSPFVPLARDERGRFVAGTMREARPGILTGPMKAMSSLWNSIIGMQAVKSGKDFLFGHPQVNIRNAAGRFAEGGQMARVGALSRVFSLFKPLVSFLGDLLPAAIGRSIPIIGWLITGIEIFNGTMGILKSRWLPELGVMVMNWWTRNQYSVGYWFGYAMGGVARIMAGAIIGLGWALKTTAQTFAANIWELGTPQGRVDLSMQIAANIQAALAKLGQNGKYGTLGGGLSVGLGSGLKGWKPGGYQVHYHTQKVTVNLQLPRGSDAASANRIMQHVKNLQGRHTTIPTWNIQTGAYNSGLATP